MSGPHRQHPGPTKRRKLLVVDLGFLGDTLHLIPALWELRRHHPEARIHVVTTPVGEEVLRLVRCVDRVWVYPLGRPSPPWWRHLGLQRALRAERFDQSFNFSGADRTLFVAAFAGIRRRITRSGSRSGIWRQWLAGTLIPAPPRNIPVFEQRLQVLAAAGYDTGTPRFDLQIPADLRTAAQTSLKNLGIANSSFVHVSINASSAFKEWPLDHWISWSQRFLDVTDSFLLATGSPAPREQSRLEGLSKAVSNPRLKILGERMSIPQLAAILETCRIHVGTDSGVTHLAMALGLPTVSVFRQYAGLEEWRPRGPHHEAVTSPCHCVDQPTMRPDCAAAQSARCLALITPESVLECTRRALSRSRPGG